MIVKDKKQFKKKDKSHNKGNISNKKDQKALKDIILFKNHLSKKQIIFIILFIFLIPLLALFLLNNHNKTNAIQAGGIVKSTKSFILDTPIPDNPDYNSTIPTLTPISTPDLGLKDPIISFSSLRIPNLMYHYIKDYNNPQDPIGTNLSVSPLNFEKQIQQIKSEGYSSISYNDLINYIYNNIKILKKKPILITFDDGYIDAYTNAKPILDKYGFTASFAIITGKVGTKGYMNWDQIKDLKRDNMEIVSHTVNHPNLTHISEKNLKYELTQSKKILDLNLSQNTQTLVYPSGFFNINVIKEALADGYKLSRSTINGQIIDPSNIFFLPVVRMTNTIRF